MPLSSFVLQPFDHVPGTSFCLTGSLSRQGSALHVRYTLTGALEALCLPPPAASPERRDNLWQESCFEFFFAEEGEEAYREVNIAPSGHWNVYCFDCYRRGMRQAGEVLSLDCRISRESRRFTLEATLDPGKTGFTGKSLRAGISAVLLARDNSMSYWALAHPGEKPDFHDRRGFLLRL